MGGAAEDGPHGEAAPSPRGIFAFQHGVGQRKDGAAEDGPHPGAGPFAPG